MGNEWIDFVRQFAKDNKITYSQAIKKAAPAYRKLKKKGKTTVRGKGDFDDLPDETQSDEIAPYMDNNSLVNFAQSNKRTNQNEAIDRDLRRRNQLAQTKLNDLIRVENSVSLEYEQVLASFLFGNAGNAVIDRYFDRVVVILHDFSKFQKDSLQVLSEQQQVSFIELKEDIQHVVGELNRVITRARNTSRRNRNPRRTTYQRVFGS